MKKILFASTALVATTTFAMAQEANVDVSGAAEMGIFGGDDIDTQFHTDINVIFAMAGETSTGVTFGAEIELSDNLPAATDNDADDGGAVIFVSGNLGTLTMGDTDGAFDRVMTEAIIGGSLRDDQEHAGYNGNSGLDGSFDGQVARYDYSFGDFAFAVSAEIDDDQDDNLLEFTDFFDESLDGTLGDFVDNVGARLQVQGAEIDNDTVLGIGASYSGNLGALDLGVGLGYQRVGMDRVVGVTRNASGTITDVEIDGDAMEVLGASLSIKTGGGLQAIVNYSTFDNMTFDNHVGLAVGYEFGDVLVAGNYGRYELDGDDNTNSGYGLVVNYDLGGGAEIQFGYGSSDIERGGVSSDSDQFSLGVAMSF